MKTGICRGSFYLNEIEKIQQLMAERGWSMYKLAKQALLSQSTLSNLINRGNAPFLCTLTKICDAFDITVSQFFNIGSEPLSLSVRQENLLKKWSALSESQKEKVDIFISGMLIQ